MVLRLAPTSYPIKRATKIVTHRNRYAGPNADFPGRSQLFLCSQSLHEGMICSREASGVQTSSSASGHLSNRGGAGLKVAVSLACHLMCREAVIDVMMCELLRWKKSPRARSCRALRRRYERHDHRQGCCARYCSECLTH